MMNWTQSNTRQWITDTAFGELYLLKVRGGERDGQWQAMVAGEFHYFNGSYSIDTMKEMVENVYRATLESELQRLIENDMSKTLMLTSIS